VRERADRALEVDAVTCSGSFAGRKLGMNSRSANRTLGPYAGRRSNFRAPDMPLKGLQNCSFSETWCEPKTVRFLGLES